MKTPETPITPKPGPQKEDSIRRTMHGEPNPLFPRVDQPPRKKEEIDYSKENPLGAVAGDKIAIMYKGVKDPDWEILSIDPRTGDAELRKGNKFAKANLEDPVIFGLNKFFKKEEGEKPPQETHHDPGNYARVMPIVQRHLETEPMKAVPFKRGDTVKVKTFWGMKDYEFIGHNPKRNTVTVRKEKKEKEVPLDKLIEWNQ